MKYKQGDIIKNSNCKRKVLGVCGEVYLLSWEDSFDSYGYSTTQTDLDELDYTLDSSDWCPEDGDRYYFVDIVNTEVVVSTWLNDLNDKKRKSLNLIFPYTPEGKKQAEQRLDEIIKMLSK